MLEGVATKQEAMATRLSDFIKVQRECNKNHNTRLGELETGQATLSARVGVLAAIETGLSAVFAAVAALIGVRN